MEIILFFMGICVGFGFVRIYWKKEIELGTYLQKIEKVKF